MSKNNLFTLATILYLIWVVVRVVLLKIYPPNSPTNRELFKNMATLSFYFTVIYLVMGLFRIYVLYVKKRE